MRAAMLTGRLRQAARLRKAGAWLVAAGVALSLGVAIEAKPKPDRSKPAAAQVAPKSGGAAGPSSKRVLTEAQKYCRGSNSCPMDGPACKKCVGK